MNQGREPDKTRAVVMQAEAALLPWEDRAHELLRVEMKRRKVSYKKLASLLEAYGFEESPDQLNRKINRRRFSAAFMFACLAAMRVETIEVPDQLTPIKLRLGNTKP